MKMKHRRGQKNKERLTDVISYRISALQRAFLEKRADEKNMGLCEAARSVLDEVMNEAGAIE